MSQLWNTYHSLESTDLALNFWLRSFLLTYANSRFFCPVDWNQVQMLPVGFYIIVDTHPSSVSFMLKTLGALWHLSRFDVTLPFFRFLLQGWRLWGHTNTPHTVPPCASLVPSNVICYCQSFISLCLCACSCLCFFSISLAHLQFNISYGCGSAFSSAPSWQAWWAQNSQSRCFPWAHVFPSPHCSVPSLCRSWSPFFPLRCESVPTLWSQIVMKVSDLLMFTDACLIFQKEWFLPWG